MAIPRILARKYKQPNEVSDFFVDWTEWFDGDPDNGIPARTDSALSYVVVDFPAALTLVDSSMSGPVVKLVIAGGVAGKRYKITLRLTTDATPAIVDEADFDLYVVEA